MLFLFSCAPQILEVEAFEPGQLSFLLEKRSLDDNDDVYHVLHKAFPEAQFRIETDVSWRRNLMYMLPVHIPDVIVTVEGEEGMVYTPATSQQIELSMDLGQALSERVDAIQKELAVPIRKQRMTLLSTTTTPQQLEQPSLNVYVGSRFRSFEEQISLHPAAQLAFGGGVQTNIMLDKHVSISDWETLLHTNSDWHCQPVQGGQSATFYDCKIPEYSMACISPIVDIIQDFERLAKELQAVVLPEDLRQSRTTEAQAQIDEIFLKELQFSPARTICLSSGCYLCTDKCTPSTAESSYQPLPPHDAAWRFCTQNNKKGGVVCAQLRFDENQMPPVISLHDDPCQVKKE